MNILVCSKPLQVMVCMLLAREMRECTLYIVDDFKGAKAVAQSSVLSRFFNNIVWFNDRKAALRSAIKARPSCLYLDSDVGFSNYCSLIVAKLAAPSTTICVYEEGIGTYRTDIIKGSFKRLVYRMFGVAYYFGGCFLTKKIFVFDVPLLIARVPALSEKGCAINEIFSCWIRENFLVLSEMFNFDYKLLSLNGEGVALYLSDWALDYEFLNSYSGREVLLLKPHPHLIFDDIAGKINNPNVIILDGGVPAELYISFILSKCLRLRIFHKNSSAVFYFKGQAIESVIL